MIWTKTFRRTNKNYPYNITGYVEVWFFLFIPIFIRISK